MVAPEAEVMFSMLPTISESGSQVFIDIKTYEYELSKFHYFVLCYIYVVLILDGTRL